VAPASQNRNFDLRREFMARADKTPIKVTSILNGAFLDMLGAEMPIIQRRIHRVLYWHDADQVLDFTTKDDVAAYTAAAALDDTTPRILRIAGDSVSARDIAATMSEVSGERYRPLWAGSLGSLGIMIRIAKLIAPRPDAPFPAWQGMQYMRDHSADVSNSPRSIMPAMPVSYGPLSTHTSLLSTGASMTVPVRATSSNQQRTSRSVDRLLRSRAEEQKRRS
jgi:hypothetical protein